MRRQSSLRLAVLLPAILIGGVSFSAAKPVSVACLSTILGDVSRNVGGDKIQVEDIVEPGVDPHEFQPTPTDVMQVVSADVVFVSGKGIEGYLTKLEESAGGKLGKFIVVGDALGTSLKLIEDGRSIEDPHWWQSVRNVRKAALIVRDTLSKVDPPDADAFKANAAAYDAKLDALDQFVKLKVAELPRDKRRLVTTHDAFQYFARDYGFKIYPIEGVTTGQEPSSKAVTELLDTIKSQRVKAVFFENIENPKVIGVITKETGAKIGGELYADGLTKDPEAATYDAMMRHNVSTIVDSLK